MSNEKKKKIERDQALAAATLMSQKWELTDSEEPDFLIKSGSQTFGLEVTQCFTGQISKKKGAVSVQDANYRAKKLSDIRRRLLEEYPEIERWSLHYAGELNEKTESNIRYVIDYVRESRGPTTMIPLPRASDSIEHEFSMPEFVSVIKEPYVVTSALWAFTRDSVGLVQKSSQQIQDTIDSKEKRLEEYIKKSEDIRLLIYCSSLRSAENVSLDNDFVPDLKGFNKVYFLHFPNYVAEFSCNTNGRAERTIHTITGRTPENL